MNKQDEEKIIEILNCKSCKEIIALSGFKCNSPCDRFKDLIEIAQWKDEQYNEEKKELIGLVNMLPVDDHNHTIIEDLIELLR